MAEIVTLFGGPVMSPRLKAMRNLIAERMLTRGRRLTIEEQWRNLEEGLGYEPGELVKRFTADRPSTDPKDGGAE